MRRVMASNGGVDGEAPVNDASFVTQPKETVSADKVRFYFLRYFIKIDFFFFMFCLFFFLCFLCCYFLFFLFSMRYFFHQMVIVFVFLFCFCFSSNLKIFCRIYTYFLRVVCFLLRSARSSLSFKPPDVPLYLGYLYICRSNRGQ